VRALESHRRALLASDLRKFLSHQSRPSIKGNFFFFPISENDHVRRPFVQPAAKPWSAESAIRTSAAASIGGSALLARPASRSSATARTDIGPQSLVDAPCHPSRRGMVCGGGDNSAAIMTAPNRTVAPFPRRRWNALIITAVPVAVREYGARDSKARDGVREFRDG